MTEPAEPSNPLAGPPSRAVGLGDGANGSSSSEPSRAQAGVAQGTPEPARGLVAKILRLGGVVAVLCAEFAFLIWIYGLDDHLAGERVALSRVMALSDVVTETGASTTSGPVADQLDRAVADLVASGAPGAAEVAASMPGDGLKQAAAASSALLEQDQTRTDHVVVLVLLALFLVVCVGWFTWFSRLARRHRATQQALTEREVSAVGERRVQALVQHNTTLVMVLDPAGRSSFVSAAARTMVGRTPADLATGSVVDLVAEHDRQRLAALLRRPDGGEHPLRLGLLHAEGHEVATEGTLKDLHDEEAVGGWVLTLRDVSERVAFEETLAHQSRHDALTGLANRTLFTERLTGALERREVSRAPLSVLFVDLDDFKLVNDSQGHQTGDALLVQVAARIQDALRPGDTTARLGGDEFAVLLPDTDLDAAARIAQGLLAELTEPFEAARVSHVVQASIGVAGVERGAHNDPHLMRNADVAMYHAKDLGKGCAATYDAVLHSRALERLQLRAELAHAIETGQLVLHYQPTVDLQSQQVSGFEALVRWQHPERGLLPPGEFIEEAERSGLIVGLGEWVLREACRAAVRMAPGVEGPSMAVNVAADQLCDPTFHDLVLDSLAQSGLSPRRLVLEITETAIVHDLDTSMTMLRALRDLGIRVALDDFGTGYNSLASLIQMPVDVLKVDKSFVDRLGGPDHDSALVEVILAMSSAMGLVTVAEGVEGCEQAQWLHDHEATLGQGFWWSRPVELEAALAILESGITAHRRLDDAA